MEGHAAHDDASYVPREMLVEWAKHDPVEKYRAWLRQHAAFGPEEDESVQKEVADLLRDAVRQAEASPVPDGSTVTDGVYAELSDLQVDEP
jgi:pyruvate dehydrogenase E1 component alpha subunit